MVETSDVAISVNEDGSIQFTYPCHCVALGMDENSNKEELETCVLNATWVSAGRVIAKDVRMMVSALAREMGDREVFMSIDVSFELNDLVFAMVATVEEKLDRVQD